MFNICHSLKIPYYTSMQMQLKYFLSNILLRNNDEVFAANNVACAEADLFQMIKRFPRDFSTGKFYDGVLNRASVFKLEMKDIRE